MVTYSNHLKGHWTTVVFFCNGKLLVWGPVVWVSNRVHLSNNPFHKGIPDIQTTNPNQQLTIGWALAQWKKNTPLVVDHRGSIIQSTDIPINFWTNDHTHDGSMQVIYLPTWMADFYGKLVGKHTVRHMDPSWVRIFRPLRFQYHFNPKSIEIHGDHGDYQFLVPIQSMGLVYLATWMVDSCGKRR